MVEFNFNQELQRWEFIVNGDIILTWELGLGSKEIKFWQDYAQETNDKARNSIGFSEADL